MELKSIEDGVNRDVIGFRMYPYGSCVKISESRSQSKMNMNMSTYVQSLHIRRHL
jgi:hypothetical protein